MKAEILAPAGSYDSLRAAIAAGADAVYIGGNRFGARAYADNLTTEQMLEAIDFCHLHGRRLYLTVNTLFKEDEIQELYDYLLPFYEKGLDAVIVQDMGALSYIRQVFPDLDIHASTQMTIAGADGARLLESLGVTRVVTSRELSLGELRKIRDSVSIEIESFVHGALCYCYSGQCLYSSLIGGRSGNRGRCAQPCRLPYEIEGKNEFLLSPKDICTLEILPEILEAGVYSLKIEGRMKRPEYTAGVVRIYRKYLDQYLKSGKKGYRISEEDWHELLALYNRGGFTTGYYKKQNGREMISLSRANHFGTKAAKVLTTKKGTVQIQALEELHTGDILENTTLDASVKMGKTLTLKAAAADLKGLQAGSILHRTKDAQLTQRLNEAYVQPKMKEKINGKLMILAGEPVILTITLGSFSVSVSGDTPKPALNQPMLPEKVRKQIEKTGNTSFIFEKLEIQMDDGLFLPLQSLNELRREGLERLTRQILAPFERSVSNLSNRMQPVLPDEAVSNSSKLYASIENMELFAPLSKIAGLSGIYLDATGLSFPVDAAQVNEYVKICHMAGKTCYYIMPHIFREDVKKRYDTEETLKILGLFDGIIFKNYETYFFLKEKGYEKALIADHNMYTYNHYARDFWKTAGVAFDTAPVELNDRELAKRGCGGSEILVYGHLPMMVSAQCIQKTSRSCSKVPGTLSVKDRKGKRFPVKNHCSFCYNTIYNQVPLLLLDNKKELDRLHPARLRLAFTIESPQEAVRITRAFVERFIEEKEAVLDFGEFTRGHFKRGIE